MKPWFLGIDLGTGNCKSVVIDAQARVLGFGSADYQAAGGNAPRHWNEQPPEPLVEGLFVAARQAIQAAQEKHNIRPGGCRAISLGCALHTLLALDAANQPLTGIITWADLRATPQAEAVRQAGQAGELYSQTGCPAHAMYPLYKILWLRQAHPDLFERAQRFVSAKEYALWRLTGDWRVDYGLASGSGMLNTFTLNWHPAALELAGITPQQLSPASSPLETLPGLLPAAAAALGLPAGTPLVLGSSDAANSSVGAGAVQPETQATCMVGTSGALRRISTMPVLDRWERTWCYAVDGQHWLAGGSINNGGVALSWLKDLLNGVPLPSGAGGNLSFEDLMALAGQAGPGADGLICLPFFTGERSPNWNMHARGVFFGLTLDHDARHLARAVLEGVAFRLRSVYNVLREQGASIHEIRASGGFTRSPLWIRTVASALGSTLEVPIWGETSSLGAALWALRASGLVGSLEAMGALVPLGPAVPSDPQLAEIYHRIFPLYEHLYNALQGSFYELAGIEIENQSPG